MGKKKYVGRGKIIGKYGNLKLNIKLSDLEPTERGYCNIIVGTMRAPDKYGNTHTVWNYDYKPQQQSQQPQTEDDLPF